MRAVGHDTGGDPLALRGAVDPGVHVVDRSVRSGGGRGGTTRLDDGGATLGDGGTVVAGQPLFVHELGRGLVDNFAKETSGYWSAEWLPHTTTSLMSAFAAPVLCASCAIARLWSRRIIAVKRDAGTSGAAFWAMVALVFAGLPTTRTRTSSAAPSLMALPWGPKMPALGLEQVGALHALAARHGTHQVRDVGALECTVDVVEDLNAGQGRERAVVELHGGALGGLTAWGISSRFSLTGTSGPNSWPEAMRNRRA